MTNIFISFSNFLQAVVFFNIFDLPLLHNSFTANIKLPMVVAFLLFGALFFTFYLGFVNVRHFGKSFGILKIRYQEASGEITHFQALCTALSGTIGLGNITGTAIGIHIGGPGVLFWIIVAGFFSMSLKAAEVTISVKYRTTERDGKISGGIFRYLYHIFANKKHIKTAIFISKISAIAILLASIGGALFQTHSASTLIASDLAIGDKNKWIIALVLAITTLFTLLGGIKRLANVTKGLTPFMSLSYVFFCLVCVVYHYHNILHAFYTIVSQAFNPSSLGGGLAAVIILGFQRAFFSNEAGIGSSTIAHSTVKTRHPASEGLVAILEPFFDTIIVCGLTGFVVIVSGAYKSDQTGIILVSQAFATLSPFCAKILSIFGLLFAWIKQCVLAFLYSW